MVAKLRSHIVLILLGCAVISLSTFFVYSHLAAAEDPPASGAPGPPSTSVSTAPADVVLAREIDRVIDESDATVARWGVFVMSLNDGRVIHSRNGDRLFTPASNMKIFTTGVALDLLGSDYRWRTSVYGQKQVESNGTLEGDLILYGRGAPDLDSKRGLPALADQIYQRGVRHVRGNIVGDESYFRGELYGSGWQWNDLQWYFGAAPSALSVDENSFEVTIAPADKSGSSASVVVSPNDNYFQLTNGTKTGEHDAPTTIGIIRELSSNQLRVWGEFPARGRSFSAFLAIHNPALRAATLFKQTLIARGIRVDGEARSRDARVPESEKFDPQKASELATVESQTLGAIVRKTNKESNNLYAELILRTLGKERGHTAPDPNPRKHRTRGDDEAGAAVIKWWLTSHGASTSALAIHDGSGLSRLDLVTPQSAVKLLMAMAKSPQAETFRDSLPIAGRDGTLRGRLLSESGRVVAKTGYLTYAQSLSGYALAAGGDTLVFSIMCNDGTGQSHPVRTIDQIAKLLAAQNSGAQRKTSQK